MARGQLPLPLGLKNNVSLEEFYVMVDGNRVDVALVTERDRRESDMDDINSSIETVREAVLSVADKESE